MRTAAPRIMLTLAIAAASAELLPGHVAAANDSAMARIAGCRVGFTGIYKVGCWTPVWVDIDPVDTDGEFVLELTASDSDGVATTISAPVVQAPSAEPTLLYTRVGRLGSPLQIVLRSEGRELDRLIVRPGDSSASRQSAVDLPANGELLVGIGSEEFGLTEAFADRDFESGLGVRRTVRLEHVSDLPADWFGYEAADVLILSTGDSSLVNALAADAPRLAAIRQWVELGGRLVILCGGRAAGDLLGNGRALATFAPGRLEAVVPLPDSGPLERFSQSAVRIASRGARSRLQVPQLTDIRGRIEVAGGVRATDLPLVIRAPLGLGEVTFAGIDLDGPPLAEWPGRGPFLRALLRPLIAPVEGARQTQNLVTSGFDDFSGALRQRLAQSFSGVHPISFGLVVTLAGAYLLALFPMDYLLVHKVLRRPWMAWLTFPLIFALFIAGALWLANSRHESSAASINQVELVDVDQASGRVRGTYWAAVYSPSAGRYDLALDVSFPVARAAAEAQTLLTWHGLPGTGIGGMQAGSAGLGVVSNGYRFTLENELLEVPILSAATKSLMARWTAPTENLIAAELTHDGGVIAGSLTNRTGVTLENARLLYGDWAHRLGRLEAGARIEIDERRRMISVPALVTGRPVGAAGGAASPAPQFDRTSVEELLGVTMFYAAAGGESYAGLPLHYQSYCDMSRLLDLGRAILVADVSGGSRLNGAEMGEPLSGDDWDRPRTVYRFVLPVGGVGE